MFDITIIIYLVVLFLILIFVDEFCPPSAFVFNDQMSPISALIMLVWLLSPAVYAIFIPEYFRENFFPYVHQNWIERGSQIVGPLMILYITFRGLLWWARIGIAGIVCYLGYLAVSFVLH